MIVNNKTLAIVGAGYRGGQPKAGVEEGPNAIRSEGLIPSLEECGWKIRDKGNIKFDEYSATEEEDIYEGMKHPKYVGKSNHKLHSIVKEECEHHNAVLTIGGDHSLAIGTISASATAWKNIAVIWIDAHGDINTPTTSGSGNIHGMPLSFLSGLADSTKYPGLEWIPKCISLDKLAYVGLRDLDAGEKEIIKKHNIKAFSMREVEKYGIAKVMDMVLEHVNPHRDTPIHLSFDVDALDPDYVASTGTRVIGGLSFREGRYLCQAVAETGCLVSMDITEVNPAIGSKEDVKKTAYIAVELAKAAFGHSFF